MKTFAFLAALLWLVQCAVQTQAQTLESANACYQRFNRLRAEGGDEAAVYAALYKCYAEYAAVLNSASPNAPAYIQSKNTLRELYPFLQSGAVYNSSHSNQQNALLFAQAFMDVPLMKAFQGETFARDD